MRRPYVVEVEVEVETDRADGLSEELESMGFRTPQVGRPQRGWTQVRLCLTADGLAQACFRAAYAVQAATGAEPVTCTAAIDASAPHHLAAARGGAGGSTTTVPLIPRQHVPRHRG